MRKIQVGNQYKKNVVSVFALLVMLLSMAGSGLAAEFVSIKIFPEHVGVFTTVGAQQFVAFGYDANGTETNITREVLWESSNEKIATINEQGLATVVAGQTSGQVKVSCSYPKAGKINQGVMLLLKSKVQ